MSSDPETSEKSYWQNVDGLVEECLQKAYDSEPDDSDDLRDRAMDCVAEACDGNWWVIYTHAARRALLYSNNEDAIFEAGVELTGDSMADVYSLAAAYALEADVRDRIEERADDYFEDRLVDEDDEPEDRALASEEV